MKNRLEIFLAASALALTLIDKTDAKEIDGAIWDEAEKASLKDKDYSLFKQNTLEQRDRYLRLRDQKVPSYVAPQNTPVAAPKK